MRGIGNSYVSYAPEDPKRHFSSRGAANSSPKLALASRQNLLFNEWHGGEVIFDTLQGSARSSPSGSRKSSNRVVISRIRETATCLQSVSMEVWDFRTYFTTMFPLPPYLLFGVTTFLHAFYKRRTTEKRLFPAWRGEKFPQAHPN
jgi:hypothetical protein